ncbi:MAG: pentapeptide repeat-containing protein [Candidatus Phlomobacter fragariae]
MNDEELKNILDEPKVYIDSSGEEGSRVDLQGANLRGADLWEAHLPDHALIITGESYSIIITNGEYLSAGYQPHTTKEWRKFTKKDIANMNGENALNFYPKLLNILDFYLGKGERSDWVKQPVN